MLPKFAKLGPPQHLVEIKKDFSCMYPQGATRSMEFWLALCEQFDCDVSVSNLIRLLKYLATLPEEKDEGRVMGYFFGGRKGGSKHDLTTMCKEFLKIRCISDLIEIP